MTSNCLHHELHRAGIDYAIIHGDPSLILLCNLAAGLQKQPGQGFQHIRLVHHGYLLAAMVERIFERETDYAAAFRMGIYP